MDCPYVHYYKAQAGGHILPLYSGNRFQVGSGFFGSLFRGLIPLVKKGLGYLGRQALDVGSHILTDTAAGDDFKTSATKRFRDARETVQSDILNKIQGGSGLKRRKTIKRTIKRLSNKSKQRHRTKDIYS